MGDYGMQSAGNARSINDEMDARIGGAGPGYTNQDRDPRATLGSASSTRPQLTIGRLAEQANDLNAVVDNLLDHVRQIADRIGAPFPPSGVSPAGAKVDINGPIDYTAQQTAIAIDKLSDVNNFVAAIGSRI